MQQAAGNCNGSDQTPSRAMNEGGETKMEEGMTIAKVPDWLELKPGMMQHLIREHEKLGRTLTEQETVALLRSAGFEISEPK